MHYLVSVFQKSPSAGGLRPQRPLIRVPLYQASANLPKSFCSFYTNVHNLALETAF